MIIREISGYLKKHYSKPQPLLRLFVFLDLSGFLIFSGAAVLGGAGGQGGGYQDEDAGADKPFDQ